VALLPHPKLSLCDGTSDAREPYSPVQYAAALLVTAIQLVYGAHWSVSSTVFHRSLGSGDPGESASQEEPVYPEVDWREWGAKCKQRAVHEAHYPWNAMQHHSVPAERRRQYAAFVREEIFNGTPMMTGQEAYFGKLCKRFAAVPADTTHMRGTDESRPVPSHALTLKRSSSWCRIHTHHATCIGGYSHTHTPPLRSSSSGPSVRDDAYVQMDADDDADAEVARPSGRPISQHSDCAAVAPTQLLGPPRRPQVLPSGVSWGLLAVPHKLKFAEMEYLEVLGACAAHVWATPWTMHNLVKAIKEALLKKEAELRWQASHTSTAGLQRGAEEGGGIEHADRPPGEKRKARPDES
jgi:hypothetical protein